MNCTIAAAAGFMMLIATVLPGAAGPVVTELALEDGGMRAHALRRAAEPARRADHAARR